MGNDIDIISTNTSKIILYFTNKQNNKIIVKLSVKLPWKYF